MNKHIEKLVALIVNLPVDDRNEAINEIHKFLEGDANKRQIIKEAFASRAGVPLGPSSEGKCPYCGK